MPTERPTQAAGAFPPVDASDVASALSSLYDELGDGIGLTAAVAAESGLDARSVRADLRDWVASIDQLSLRRLASSASRAADPTAGLLTLAPGNIPIVGAECLVLGLLAGGHHTLALSTRATALPIALTAHLERVVRDLDARLELVVWRHLSAAERGRLLSESRRVAAYGTAETVEWLAERVGRETIVVPHGPSVALAYLDPGELDESQLDELLGLLAVDVARWDQRGCRSPHALLVVGSHDRALDLAQRLALEALPAAAATRPRGQLTEAEAAAGYLDGLTSAALGFVVAGPSGTVTVEDRPRVLRPSPLGRTLRVIAIDGPDEASRLAASLPAPVGTLAVEGADAETIATITSGLDGADAIECVDFGSLQTPRFERPHDGRHRLDELRPLGG